MIDCSETRSNNADQMNGRRSSSSGGSLLSWMILPNISNANPAPNQPTIRETGNTHIHPVLSRLSSKAVSLNNCIRIPDSIAGLVDIRNSEILVRYAITLNLWATVLYATIMNRVKKASPPVVSNNPKASKPISVARSAFFECNSSPKIPFFII